jgi:8-oxo-dGTP pyrophosphatase MutT (NUDIX family)
MWRLADGAIAGRIYEELPTERPVMSMSPYVRELRRRAGAMRLLLPSVSAHVFDSQGRLLLVRLREGGEWTTPGGLIEPDELPADSVVREVWEETGLIVKVERLAGIYSGPDCLVRYVNGDEVQYTIAAFACIPGGGSIRPDHEETVQVEYFSRREAEAVDLTSWLRAHLDIVFGTADRRGFREPGWRPPPFLHAVSADTETV